MDALLDSAIPRRTVLAAALAAVGSLAVGCSRPGSTQEPSPTVSSLISATPFLIAHRGGGDDWPEMTLHAYGQAAQLDGLRAIEVSVCLSADGVLVCSHDTNTRRVTGADLVIAEQPWSRLATLEVTSAYTIDPTQPARPFSRFDEVVTAHIGRLVTFVEPKTPEAVAPLMAALTSLQQPERVVWKQPVNQPHFGQAKAQGFSTWGYVLDEPGHLGKNLARLSASHDIDMLGAPALQPDSFVSDVVAAARANGKKTIMWPIRNDADKERALRLGCEGLMTSNVVQVH